MSDIWHNLELYIECIWDNNSIKEKRDDRKVFLSHPLNPKVGDDPKVAHQISNGVANRLTIFYLENKITHTHKEAEHVKHVFIFKTCIYACNVWSIQEIAHYNQLPVI